MVRKARLRAVILVLFACAASVAAQVTIRLDVDASEAFRNIVHVKEVLDVRGGDIDLFYPKWIPGEHAPDGTINDMVNSLSMRMARLSLGDAMMSRCSRFTSASQLVSARSRSVLTTPRSPARSIRPPSLASNGTVFSFTLAELTATISTSPPRCACRRDGSTRPP